MFHQWPLSPSKKNKIYRGKIIRVSVRDQAKVICQCGADYASHNDLSSAVRCYIIAALFHQYPKAIKTLMLFFDNPASSDIIDACLDESVKIVEAYPRLVIGSFKVFEKRPDLIIELWKRANQTVKNAILQYSKGSTIGETLKELELTDQKSISSKSDLFAWRCLPQDREQTLNFLNNDPH